MRGKRWTIPQGEVKKETAYKSTSHSSGSEGFYLGCVLVIKRLEKAAAKATVVSKDVYLSFFLFLELLFGFGIH